MFHDGNLHHVPALYIQDMAVLTRSSFVSYLKHSMHPAVEERQAWLTQSPVVTICPVEGYHHVHLEDAPLVAGKISEWVLAQDEPAKARL